MAMPVNPYVTGNPVGDSTAFVGRADVLRRVWQILCHPEQNAILLYGQRRIGKTSVLQHLAAWHSCEGPYHFIYFDLQDKADQPLGRVLQDLACTIAHALGQPNPNLGSDPETAFRQTWLPAMLNALPNGHTLVLLFDEFDVLADPKAEQAAAAFFPYLRDLLATIDPRRLEFVFVIGRNVGDLSNIALSLFKGVPYQRVSLLNREDAANLVRLSETNNTLYWPDEAVELVWRLTCGHPLLTQALCFHVWELAYEAEPDAPPTVAPGGVEAAIPGTLETVTTALEWLWDGLPPAERVVASALAGAGPGPITQEQLERLLHESGVRVVIRELQNAPQLLQEWDLIEPADGGYCFRVELLRRWLVDHKPLQRVREELDHIEPAAENLYRATLDLYRGGRLEQAVDWLRQAIGLNPSHLRANELLADILLAQGKVDEARQLLERLYEIQPTAARPRLVQALLTLAQAAESDDEQLPLFERVLEIDPQQPEAIAGRVRIWQWRGDAARADDNLEAALEAYRKADLIDQVVDIQQEMRRRGLAARLLELEALEQTRQYQDAMDLVLKCTEEYPGMRNWAADLERLERKTHLTDLYQRALGAIQTGDMKTAQTFLAQVIGLEPEYEEATRYLHLAVTGVDVANLQAPLAEPPTPPKPRPRSLLRVPSHQRLLPIMQWFKTLQFTTGATGNFLASTLTWLPLFIPILALGNGNPPYAKEVSLSTACLWISLGLVLAWLLSLISINDEDVMMITVASGTTVIFVMGFVTVIIASATTHAITGGVERNVGRIWAGCIMTNVALIVAGIAARGTVRNNTSRVTRTVATAAAFVDAFLGVFIVAFIIVFAIAFVVIYTAANLLSEGAWASFVANLPDIVERHATIDTMSDFKTIIAVFIALGVAGFVALKWASDEMPAIVGSIGALGAIGMSLLAHTFLIWFYFLDGWRMFQ